MRFSARQIFTALISMVVTLGVLFAGLRVYHSQLVDTPLVSSLGSVQGVSQAHLQGSTVVVRMNPGSNLMTVYQSVVQKAAGTLGHAPKKVDIVSRPDAALDRIESNVPFVIAQGEATGHFVVMKSAIQKMAQKEGIAVTEQMDAHHLYLTFRHHHQVLYDVVPISIGGSGRA